MSVATVERIQAEFVSLEESDQLSLLQRLNRLVSERVTDHRSDLCRELDALAADPDIQRELKAIDAEFESANSDGLELFP